MTNAVEFIGLTKRFSNHVTAVDDLSLTVAQGQVVGLLGPNGSGKTTTLRMLVGLVQPTAGAAYVFSERITPGHAVLRRVGALIEGPAFVPHLSGLQNLRFFWQAGGQPLGEAHLEEALAVAQLGDAIHRKAGTYSKGMQQRLALAQALLNDPELLILDEPTVGLDPQEMRHIRQLIHDVAARGSTVLLSSHLLAEVEQVCSHVAVLDHGRLVASGRVSDLVGTVSSVYIEVSDTDRALEVLRCISGVAGVTPEPPGLVLKLNGVQREHVISTLVSAGIGIETVVSRRSLEEAFLQLVQEEQR